MSTELDELKSLFPTAKEITITDKKILVKPMVWFDILFIVEEFMKIVSKISANNPKFKLTEFDETKDFEKLIPVMGEIFVIFSKWLKVDADWLKKNLTLKRTMQLVIEFFEINEWQEVKKLFFQAALQVKGEEAKG